MRNYDGEVVMLDIFKDFRGEFFVEDGGDTLFQSIGLFVVVCLLLGVVDCYSNMANFKDIEIVQVLLPSRHDKRFCE